MNVGNREPAGRSAERAVDRLVDHPVDGPTGKPGSRSADPPIDLDRYHAVLTFAAQAHRSQRRKGSQIPYITHPVAVSAILAQYGFSEEVVLAGLLHDAVEDTGVTLEEVTRRFGRRVADLVAAVTERKTENGLPRPWEVRKAEQLQHLSLADPEAVALKAADALHNVDSILRDLVITGPQVWSRFKRPAADQITYYRRLSEAITARLGAHPLAAEFAARVEELSARVEELAGKA